MKGTIVAARYAKSLIDLAIEQNQLEEVYADMQHIAKTCEESRELSVMLKSPVIKHDKKHAILSEIFGGLSKTTEAIITLLTSKHREAYLEGIAKAFVAQYKQHKNIQTAVITTAVPLTDEGRQKVTELVKSTQAGISVELKENIDADILGGFVLRVGDKQVDASIARKLRDMTMEFSKNPYLKDF